MTKWIKCVTMALGGAQGEELRGRAAKLMLSGGILYAGKSSTVILIR